MGYERYGLRGCLLYYYYSSDGSANWATGDASQTREVQYRSISAPASTGQYSTSSAKSFDRRPTTPVGHHLTTVQSLSLASLSILSVLFHAAMVLDNKQLFRELEEQLYKDVSRPSSGWEAMALVLPSNAKYWCIFQHVIYAELKIMSTVRI